MAADPNCTEYAPSSQQLLASLGGFGIAILTSCTVCTCVVVIFYLEAVYYLYKRISNKYRRIAVLWVLGIYPVHCICSLLGLYVPLAYLIVNLTAATYLSIAVYLFLVLLFEFYGSDRQLYTEMQGKVLPMTEMPYCCCCKCLPELNVTKSFMKKLNMMVYQIAIFRPIVLYIELIAWSDRGYQSGQLAWDDPYFYIITAITISTLVGVYGLSAIYKLARDPLEGYRIRAKFICLQLALVFANIQPFVISIFTTGGLIKCNPPINFESRSWWIHNFLQVYEMTIIFFAAHAFYRQEKGNVDNIVRLKYSKDDRVTDIDITTHDSRGFQGNIESMEDAFQEGDLDLDTANNFTEPLEDIAVTVVPIESKHGVAVESSNGSSTHIPASLTAFTPDLIHRRPQESTDTANAVSDA